MVLLVKAPFKIRPPLLDSVSLLLLVVIVSRLSSLSSSLSTFIRKMPRTSFDDTLRCDAIKCDATSPPKFGVDATGFSGLVPRVAPCMRARPLLMTI
jgi:hypothetical protein